MSLVILVTLTFLFLRLLPGGPFDNDISLHPLVQHELEKSWHLHSSLSDQYFSYVRALANGDLGVSLIRGDQRVSEVLVQGLRQTLSLNIISLFFIYTMSLSLAIAWGLSQKKSLSQWIEQFEITLISLPSLFIAPLLIFVFGFYFDILPVAFLSSPVHFILPVFALSLRPIASLSRLLQKSIQSQWDQDYVRAARAKGLSEKRILLTHVMKNSLIPLLSYSGPLAVSLLSGSFLIEMLFAIPGLGTEFISSLNDRDYTVIGGLSLFYGSLLIVFNLFLDFLMRWADPRLKDKA